MWKWGTDMRKWTNRAMNIDHWLANTTKPGGGKGQHLKNSCKCLSGIVFDLTYQTTQTFFLLQISYVIRCVCYLFIRRHFSSKDYESMVHCDHLIMGLVAIKLGRRS
jgi:hypothetical protein